MKTFLVEFRHIPNWLSMTPLIMIPVQRTHIEHYTNDHYDLAHIIARQLELRPQDVVVIEAHECNLSPPTEVETNK